MLPLNVPESPSRHRMHLGALYFAYFAVVRFVATLRLLHFFRFLCHASRLPCRLRQEEYIMSA